MEQKLPTNPNQTFYENTGFQFNRTKNQSLTLDVIIFPNPDIRTPPTFTCILTEPLIIDKLSDIYLDSFITTRQIANNAGNTTRNMCFLLTIDQFNVQSKVATNFHAATADGNIYSNQIPGKIVIPNEAGGNDPKIHKGKKMNYICSINPTRLNQITGNISDNGLQGNFDVHSNDIVYGNPFDDVHANTAHPARFIAEFVIIDRE